MSDSVTIWLYDKTWPFARSRWLPSVAQPDYSFELMNYGKFQFSLPRNAPVEPDDLVDGLIGITSRYGAPDFCGIVDRIEDQDQSGAVTVSGREWAGKFADRLTPQALSIPAGGSGQVAGELVRRINARNQTGITVVPSGTSQPLIAAYNPNSNSLLQALGDIAAQTGWEWEVRYTAGVSAQARFTWKSAVGQDLRNQTHVTARSMHRRQYDVDATTQAVTVATVAATGIFSGRPSSVSDLGTLAFDDLAQTVQRAPATLRKAHRRIASREQLIIAPTLPSAVSASARSRKEMEASAQSTETLSFGVTTDISWGLLRPGNYVTVRIPDVRFGDGLVRVLRVLGMQPDHAAGCCYLVGEVYPA